MFPKFTAQDFFSLKDFTRFSRGCLELVKCNKYIVAYKRLNEKNN